MALLQISEPGQSTKPHEHKLAAGIDLGTSNSLIATVRSGKPVVLLNDEDRDIHPSVVHYAGESKILVGAGAIQFLETDPLNTISSVKRLMGRGREAVHSIGGQLPYELVATEGMARINTRVGEKTPVEVSAEILKHLKSLGEQSLGESLSGVVITVPAYFDDAQRQATRDAARLAGLNVFRLLNEPTAAAIAYGLDQSNDGIFAVYDLGGGTFDITVLHLSNGVFEVLATGGDSALGGDDFDRLITEWIIDELGIKELNPGCIRYLSRLACEAKECLSETTQTVVPVELDGVKKELVLTAEKLSELIRPLMEKTLRACRKTVKDAGLEIDAIGEVIMVGGSTRTLAVRKNVSEFFRREVLTNIDPDRVVAIGAAVQADVLAGNAQDGELLLLDVLPLSLGIETMGGLAEKIILRNTPLPAARAQEFTTFKDGQTAMAIHVVQGERELVSDCRSLAKFTLSGIPPMTAGAARIQVSFRVDADGMLGVSARELSTGTQSSIDVKPSYGLTEEEIARMLKESFANAETDAQTRSLNEARLEAQRLLEALESALAIDGGKILSVDEKGTLENGMIELRTSLEQAEVQDLIEQTEKLNEASQEYASRRMDQNIRKALSGQKIAEVDVKTIEDRDSCLK